MSLETHLSTLEQRHAALDNEIATAATRPSLSDMELADMKRRKLKLRDEIERLRINRQ